jgi:hypothetical protein
MGMIDTARDFAASEAFKTLVAGAFGAFFGAWGAQIIISRNQNRQAVVTELNCINAALGLLLSILQIFIGLKQQHVGPMLDRYAKQQKAYVEGVPEAKQASQAQVVRIQFDLQTLSPVRTPTEALERLVFEKISFRGRGPSAAVDLIASIDSLAKSIAYRNELVEELRIAKVPHPQLAQKYFGVPTSEGVVDERLQSNLRGIYEQTDNCIFFSRQLADDLVAYGKRLWRRHRWKYLRPLPKMAITDWSLAENAGLIPSNEQYAQWLKRFKPKQSLFTRAFQWARSSLFVKPRTSQA